MKTNLIKRIEKQILKTPTGELRELLCDINLFIQTLPKESDQLLKFLNWYENRSGEEIGYDNMMFQINLYSEENNV